MTIGIMITGTAAATTTLTSAMSGVSLPHCVTNGALHT
jgi:hypothetical protein